MAVCEKQTAGERLRGQLSVTFLVRRKLGKSRLPTPEVIPAIIELRDGTRVQTDVLEVAGVPLAQSGLCRPLRPGCSLAHVRGLPGSMGPIVKRVGEGRPLFLSCSHVIARGGLAAAGDPIEQPPDFDDAIGPNVVGTLTDDFTRLSPVGLNDMDAALAEIAPTLADVRAHANEPLGGVNGARIAGVSDVRVEDLNDLGAVALTRFGAATGVQPGVLAGVHGAISLGTHALSGDIVFGPVGLYQTFSRPGDSGAPILRDDTGDFFGMHIGAVDGLGVFIPARTILDRFGIELFSD